MSMRAFRDATGLHLHRLVLTIVLRDIIDTGAAPRFAGIIRAQKVGGVVLEDLAQIVGVGACGEQGGSESKGSDRELHCLCDLKVLRICTLVRLGRLDGYKTQSTIIVTALPI